MRLKGKVALVTGGARRLGRAIALKLAGEGANIALHYHTSAPEAAATVETIAALGVEATLIRGDLSQPAQAEQVVAEAALAWGRLDILINNAAIFYRTPLGHISEAQWDALLNTNLKGPFFCAQRAGAEMRRHKEGGVIINFTDTGIYLAWKGYLPYLISKAGIAHMTYGLAKELAPQVRVNAIAPGPALLPDDHPQAEADRAARGTLLNRIGSPAAIAEATLYLVQADFITGVVLPVDGGQRWQRPA